MVITQLRKALTRHRYIGRRPERPLTAALQGPDWAQASPARIEKALERTLSQTAGGWYVVDASRQIGASPKAYTVAGQNLVLWRDGNSVHAAPEACPHMGASLVGAEVCDGRLICPWHALALGPEGHGAWKPCQAHDDGVLVWVQRPDGDERTPAPILAPRPTRFLDAVIRMEADCDPEDVIANRLDPWHGCHFHPYSFAELAVTEATDERLGLRVSYRIAGPLVMEVDAVFHTPDPRTIVMTIVDGDGVGSVVETHATPLGPGRTAIIEATLATSERSGFQRFQPAASALLRPFIRRSAQRLWVDDIAYAERRYWLRSRGEWPGSATR